MTDSKEERNSIVGKYPTLSRITIASVAVILDYLVYIGHYSLNDFDFFQEQCFVFINFLAIYLILFPSTIK